MKKRAAIYVRVSRTDQNLENQIRELTEWAATRQLKVVATYEDKMSGAKKSRPGLDALKLDGHKGKFDVLLVWAVDRLGRSMAGTIDTVLQFDGWGVQVMSLQEPWLDTAGPVRALLLSIFSWVAEQERARNIERTRAGIETARAAGKTLGRPKKEVDLDLLIKLRAGGMGLKDIAKKVGLSVGAVHYTLKASDVPARFRTSSREEPVVAPGPKPRIKRVS